MRPARDAVIPLNQTPIVDPDETLDEAFEWLGGRDGLVLKTARSSGALGPRDVEHWYRRGDRGPVVADRDSHSCHPARTSEQGCRRSG